MSQEKIATYKLENNPKLFITNLPPSIQEEQLRDQLQRLFEVFGRIVHLNVKKNKNGQYSFAFLEFERFNDAEKAINEMDQKQIHGRPMKVRQDRQMEGCFNCKKQGHFAKQCPQRSDRSGNYRRRSPYREYDRRERRKSRSRSHDKYQRSRSRSYSSHGDRRNKDYRKQRNYRERSHSREQDYRRRDYDRDYRRDRDYDRGRGYDRHKYQRRQHYSRSRSQSYER